jgi:hypothetical protein
MSESNTLGPYLRSERESRGLTLKTISESTKVSVALLEGLEADDLSRWPGGIFRRAFVRSYAQCVGLDPDDVFRRFESQYQPPPEVVPVVPGTVQPAQVSAPVTTQWAFGEIASAPAEMHSAMPSQRARTRGTAADLTVAAILAFSFAAAGSRLLWPVLLIAAYYAAGVLLTGTSPMVALLSDEFGTQFPRVPRDPAAPGGGRAAAEGRLQASRLTEPPTASTGVQARAQ